MCRVQVTYSDRKQLWRHASRYANHGARMTVRSSPSSKHVPRKERRYHVKKRFSAIRAGQGDWRHFFYELILYSLYLLMCLLSESRVGEAWEPSTTLTLFLPPNRSASRFYLPYPSLTYTASWDSLSLVRFHAVEWPRHFDRGGSRSLEVRLYIEMRKQDNYEISTLKRNKTNRCLCCYTVCVHTVRTEWKEGRKRRLKVRFRRHTMGNFEILVVQTFN